MPTYQYSCLKCGNSFESFQKMNDRPLEHCPSCGGEVKRLISGGAGFLFKGTGFYITDYRSSDYKKAAKSEAESAAPKTTSAEKATAKTPD